MKCLGMGAMSQGNEQMILWRSVHADWRMQRPTESPPARGRAESLPRQLIATATQPRGPKRQEPK